MNLIEFNLKLKELQNFRKNAYNFERYIEVLKKFGQKLKEKKYIY